MSDLKFSTPVSEPILLDDIDLMIIRSALINTRKKSGSVRADQLIEMITNRLRNPDTHTATVDCGTLNWKRAADPAGL